MESELAIINACIKGNFKDIREYLSAGGSLELKDRVIKLYFSKYIYLCSGN
jgi:hypothetical protein